MQILETVFVDGHCEFFSGDVRVLVQKVLSIICVFFHGRGLTKISFRSKNDTMENYAWTTITH